MSTMEFKRRRIASAVFKEAWNYNRKTDLFRLTFASSLKLAWRTVRSTAKLIHSKIRGVVHSGRQLLLQRLSHYTQEQVVLSFRREHSNPHDKNAVQIIASSVRTDSIAILGYLSARLAVDVANILDGGQQAIIVSWDITGGGKQYWGCNFTYVIQ